MVEINKEEFEQFAQENFPGKAYNFGGTFFFIQAGNCLGDELHYEYFEDKMQLHIEGRNWRGIRDFLRNSDLRNRDKVYSSWWDRNDCAWTLLNTELSSWEDVKKAFITIDSIINPYIQEFERQVSLQSNQIERNTDNNDAKTQSIIGQYKEIPIEGELSQKSDIDLHLCTLREIMALPLAIPDYQRIYCWDEQNVMCLLEDIFNYVSNHSEKWKYRLGTIILHYNDKKYDIIDGQQRLITLALLLDKLETLVQLLKCNISSKQSKDYIAYNKYLIEVFYEKRKEVINKNLIREKILDNIEFSVLILQNTSLDLAYTFFSNQNSRGVVLSDYDLLKAHHLRFIPYIYEQQATNAAQAWNKMIENGRSKKGENEAPDYERTLDTYIYRLRRWTRKKECEDETKKYRVKQEYEAAPIIDGIPPFGERFYFNEPIQGGAHFFEYVKQHLEKYKYFVQTKEYQVLHSIMEGHRSFQHYRDVIEGILFAYYLKFGENYLGEAMMVIMRCILQHRYESKRATKSAIIKAAKESDFVLMIDQATSPTFFLAEARNAVKDLSYIRRDLSPIQIEMRNKARQISEKIELTINLFKNLNK